MSNGYRFQITLNDSRAYVWVNADSIDSAKNALRAVIKPTASIDYVSTGACRDDAITTDVVLGNGQTITVDTDCARHGYCPPSGCRCDDDDRAQREFASFERLGWSLGGER